MISLLPFLIGIGIIALFIYLRRREIKKEPEYIANVRKAKAMMEWHDMIESQIESAFSEAHFKTIDALLNRFQESYRDVDESLGLIEELQLQLKNRKLGLKLPGMHKEDLLFV